MAFQQLILVQAPANDLAKYENFHLDAKQLLNYLMNELSGINGGYLNASVSEIPSGTAVQASGTATLNSVVATNTLVVGNQTLTAHASTQDGTHFVVGVSDTATAANLATCINANTTLSKIVVATSAANVVTIISLQPGVLANQLPLADGGSGNFAVSGSTLAGGVGDLTTLYHYGF